MLDPFHAIKRLTGCIPATDPNRKKICSGIGLFVRQIDDVGDKRLKPTDNPENMICNLDRIILGFESDGKFLDPLTPCCPVRLSGC